MIRLLLLIPTLDQSGAEKQLTLLARGLPPAEFEVRVCCLTRGGPYARELEAAGISVDVLGKRFKFDPLALARLRRLLSDWKPDILHTWLFAANSYGRLAAGARPAFGVVVSERCVDSWKANWQFWVDSRLAPRTDRLIANSQSVAEFYRGRGFPRERISVVPNGIALPTDVPDRRRVRAELGVGLNVPVVCSIGRLARQKRVQDLIWGFELMRAVRGDVVFLIAGDGPERQRLEASVRGLGLERHVLFLGHRSDAPELLAASDLLWLASDFEGMSNSLMEAMAAGKPVVASDIPPNRELVVPGETGFLVPVGDRVAYAQFAERILFDPDLAARLGRAGRDRIAGEFSIERMVAAHAGLYQQILASRRPCAA